MGQLNIWFRGICTIMQKGSETIPWSDRIVLADASNPNTIANNPQLAGRGITPHFGQLQIETSAIVSMSKESMPGFMAAPPIPIPGWPPSPVRAWQLERLHITIANERAPDGQRGFPVDGAFFHLRSFVLGNVMPPPKESMLLGSVPEGAACIFDANSGTLQGLTPGNAEAIAGLLQLETWDTNPIIEVRSFAGPEEERIYIEVLDGSTITLGNGPASLAEDKDQDFRLNYLTASVFPIITSVPGGGGDAGAFPERMSTYGCSNSIYP